MDGSRCVCLGRLECSAGPIDERLYFKVANGLIAFFRRSRRRLACPFENEPGVSGSGQESKLTMRPERVCDGVDPF